MADVLRGSPFEGNGRPARLAHAAAARWMDQLASHQQQQQQVERPADRTDSAPPPLLPCVVAAATNDVDFLKANASQLQINASDDQCVYFFSVECDSIALLFDCLFSWLRLAFFFFFPLRGRPLLCVAAKAGHIEVAELLVQMKANVNVQVRIFIWLFPSLPILRPPVVVRGTWLGSCFLFPPLLSEQPA